MADFIPIKMTAEGYFRADPSYEVYYHDNTSQLKTRNHVTVCGVALFSWPEGEVLLGKRIDKKNSALDGKWDIPGGKLEFGEEPVHCAIREFEEELGQRIPLYSTTQVTHATSVVWVKEDSIDHVTLVFYGVQSHRIMTLLVKEGKFKLPTMSPYSELQFFDVRNGIPPEHCLPTTLEIANELRRRLFAILQPVRLT